MYKRQFAEVIQQINPPPGFLHRIIPQPRQRRSVWERLRLAAEELGPTFVKSGQLLSMRPDVIPEALVSELRRLQDNVKPLPFAEMRPGCYDIHQRVRDMDRNGILGSICFPTFAGFSAGHFRHVKDEVTNAMISAYNDWHIAAWCGAYPDRFIPLEERREFAEKNQAALFIAIHADYAGSSARGATIYSLRDNVANELRRSARGEALNGDIENRIRPADPRDASAVRGILADLQQMEVEVNKQRSSLFARSVIEYMGEQTNMMSNPDRTAAFTVLRTAKVPAVLIELAFVTNREDAAKLKSDEWRSKVAESIQTAIDNYFSHQVANNPYVAASAPVDQEPTRQAVPGPARTATASRSSDSKGRRDGWGPGWRLREPFSARGSVIKGDCLLYTSPSPRDRTRSRMPTSA